MPTHYLIAGNGAAGVTAAEEIRKRDPQGGITVLSAEPHPMYSRPGLAYVIINEVSTQQVLARRPEWYAQQRLQLVYGTAVQLDAAAKQVVLTDGTRLPFDKLLIATGARAVPPPYPGAQLDGVVYLDTLAGTEDLLRRVKTARRAVVIGGGITALEMTEGLAHQQVETHYFVRKNALWSTVFNEVESRLLEERMQRHHVHIHYNTEVTEIVGDAAGRVRAVRLTNGEEFACDLLGAAIGVVPQLEWVKSAGLKQERGLLVNEFLETSAPEVYAAGDVAQIYDRWTQKHLLDVLWPSAIAAGKVAGANMTGARQAYVKGTPFNACLLFGLHITAIGQLGTARGSEVEEMQHLSRGASEVWATPPKHYVGAWSQDGPNTVRLAVSGNKLVGALVVGKQTLADPLRDLIEQQVDITPLQPYLQAGGPAMAAMVEQFWRQRR